MTSNSIRIIGVLFLVCLLFINFIIGIEKIKLHLFNDNVTTTKSSFTSEPPPVVLDLSVNSENPVNQEVSVTSTSQLESNSTLDKRFDERKSTLKNFCGKRWDPIKPRNLGYRSNVISKFGISKSNIPFFVCLAPKAGSTSLTTILLEATGFFDDGKRQSSNVGTTNLIALSTSWN